jgi:amidase
MQAISYQDPHLENSEVAYFSINQLKEAFALKRLTPHHLLDQLMDRIEDIDNEDGLDLCAVIDIDYEAAESARKESEGGALPLAGIPVIIKDNIEVENWVCGAGTVGFTQPAVRDAALVIRLKAAGAIPFASANMTEWAASSTETLEEGQSTRGGLTGNPWALDRSAGTSSSGSAAAVAAGFAPIAIGTETMGSISMPASHCGVLAMKATRGSIPTDGIIPYSGTQDVPGVFARTLDDIETVMAVLMNQSMSPKNNIEICIGRDPDLRDSSQADDELNLAFESLCEQLVELGSTTTEIPRIDREEYNRIERVLSAELVRDLDGYLARREGARWKSVGEVVQASQIASVGSDGEILAPTPCESFESALNAVPIYIEQQRTLSEAYFEKLLSGMLGSSDVLLGIAYGPADKLDTSRRSKSKPYRYHSFLDSMSSIVGWPALTIPFTQINELPVGLILVAQRNCEASILGAARLLERNGLAGTFQRPVWRLPQRG